MDIRMIRSLAKLMENSGLTAVRFEQGDMKISLERQTYCKPSPVTVQTTAMPEIIKPAQENIKPDGFTIVKSPLVGVFYDAPSPGAEPFVKKGDKIKKGDVLCIIEAMKIMNEITAENDGEIEDICVENGQIVEYGQLLYKLSR